MAQQIIDLGAAPNDGTGDDLREGAEKMNENFTELYGLLPSAIEAANRFSAPFAFWADLVAVLPYMIDGLRAEVSAEDTGTHTDPVTGPGALNAGLYEKQSAYSDPVRVADLDSQLSSAQATLAGHYANDDTDVDVPGGAAGERGAKYWSEQAYLHGVHLEQDTPGGPIYVKDADGLVLWQITPDGGEFATKRYRPGPVSGYADKIDVDAELNALGTAVASIAGITPSATKASLLTAIRRGFHPRLMLATDADYPTITVGAETAIGSSAAATTIVGSVLVAHTSSKFEYDGGAPYVPSGFPNNQYARCRRAAMGYTDGTNTTAYYADAQIGVRFMHTGPVLEVLLQASGANLPSMLIINGKLSPVFTVGYTTGQAVLVRVAFGGSATREIIVHTAAAGFGGVRTASAGDVGTLPYLRPIATCLGDSWWDGTGKGMAGMGQAEIMARVNGLILRNGGVGSTGIVQQGTANNIAGQPLKNYIQPERLALFCDPAASIGIVCGSQNDSSVLAGAWPTGATTLQEAIRLNMQTIITSWLAVNAGKPLVFLSGQWPTDLAPHSMFLNRDAIHASAEARYSDGMRYVEEMEPGFIHAAQATVTYTTGTPGSTAGPDGNAGIYLGGSTGSDTAHPSPNGHIGLGLRRGQRLRSSIIGEVV